MFVVSDKEHTVSYLVNSGDGYCQHMVGSLGWRIYMHRDSG